jgi:ribosome-associated protein
VADAIDDKKGQDLRLLDVSDILRICDVFVIATGNSSRHVRTLADNVEERLSALGRKPLRREGLDEGTWVLLDYGEIVVHLFDPATRGYYELERLWADAPRVQWQPGQQVATPA